MRRRWLLVPAVLVLLLLPPLAVYLLFPQIVLQAAQRYGPEYGVEVTAIDLARPGFGALEVRRLVLEAGRYRLTGNGLQLRYSPGGLFRGGLEALQARDVELTVLGETTTATAPAEDVSAADGSDADLLFALVPAEQVQIERFRVYLEALDFAAAGTLTLDEQRLAMTLTTETPALAEGVNFAATLTRDRDVSVDFRPADPSANPFFTLRSEVPQQALQGSVTIDLADFSWDVLATALDLPPGEAVVSGTGHFAVPWPLPESQLEQALTAELELTGRWFGSGLSLAAEAVAIGLSDGAFTVEGPVDAELADAGNRLVWKLEEVAGRLDGSALEGSGPVTLSLQDGAVSLMGPLAASGSVPDLAGRLSFTGMVTAEPHARSLAAELTVGREGSEISGQATLSSLPIRDLPVRFRYNPTDGSYRVEGEHRQRFDGGILTAVFPDWSEPYDLEHGELTFAYRAQGSGQRPLQGELGLTVVDGDGFYESVVLRGVEAALQASIEGGELELLPSPLTATLVDAGVPIEAFETTLAGNRALLELGPTRGKVLGGELRIPAFGYVMETGAASLSVELDGLDLAEVLALEGEDITGNGVIDGFLPLHFAGGEISVSDGRLAAREPGGVIRLNPRFANALTQPGLDIAMRALTDFRFQRLEATADYSPEGDLALGVRLEGRNPELEAGRPIHFNLTVSENIPVLLRSLRLKDEFTRRIEEQVTQ